MNTKNHTLLVTKIVQSLASTAILVSGSALHAALQDEIRVFTDELQATDRLRVNAHINLTPSTNDTPQYTNEVLSSKSVRLTPEFVYGINRDVEVAAYTPIVRKSDGTLYLAGVKARTKWMPVKPNTAKGDGYFAGVNWDFQSVKSQFLDPSNRVGMKGVLGGRSGRWSLAYNPGLTWALDSDAYGKKPESAYFNQNLRIGFNTSRDTVWAVEYYSEMGSWNNRRSYNAQNNRVFAVLNWDDMEFGIGKNTTDAADRWTVKATFNVPLR